MDALKKHNSRPGLAPYDYGAISCSRTALRIAIISPTFPPEQSGVGDHTAMLASAFAAAGHEVTVFTTRGLHWDDAPLSVHVHAIVERWHPRTMPPLAAQVAALQPDVVFIQYVPTLYARAGVGVTAPRLAWALRSHGMSIVTIVHEPYVPLWLSAKHLVVGLAQRVELIGVMAASKAVATSTLPWRQELRRWMPWRAGRFRRVPVGSNIPYQPLSPAARVALRTQLGLQEDELLLVFFGSFHETKLMGMVLRSLLRALSAGYPARLLMVGVLPGALKDMAVALGVPLERLICTGYISADMVSAYLQCGDLLIAPLMDGVSTRRTSVLAALQHGLPVATTAGWSTERDLFAGSVAMAPDGDTDAYLQLVERLASDPAERARLVAAGQRLMHDRFTWPRVAGALLDLASPARRRH